MRLVILIILMTFQQSIFAQDEPVQFEKTIEYQDYRHVFFAIDRVATEAEAKYLSETFLGTPGVVDFSIQEGKYCKLGIKYDKTIDDVAEVLNQFNFKISDEIAVANDNDNKKADYPTHYPVRKSTGDPARDEQIFQEAYKYWKTHYPEEYNTYKENK
ncbi:MAG: hypothetical protein A2W91_15045 [Bacteroidetes bacterium GWF2_38_335]|nr:MAG: hypothetical protein A2W91_15045 [Bacteroidetes bacterium GWF2_38_335]OFY78514.1 MAG: hypothetical protein A2281_16355 [Bacteroidetes bacterium RIFOXYA12_FULL_38_20]HBS88463.1 hypothetical protein [Bacteroidales bacterium]